MLTKKQAKVYHALRMSVPFTEEALVKNAQLHSRDETVSVLMELFYLDIVQNIVRNASGTITDVTISTKGENYRELCRMERIERWKERGIGFVFGVLASVAAGLSLHFILGIG